MKIGLPTARLVTAATLTLVSPAAAAAAVVVMPATGVLLPIWNVVWLPT
jgi:hypothetical protein